MEDHIPNVLSPKLLLRLQTTAGELVPRSYNAHQVLGSQRNTLLWDVCFSLLPGEKAGTMPEL